VSTRQENGERLFARPTAAGRLGGAPFDLSDTVGLVARSRRELLLAAHRHRLGHEDLEDCYSQATLELLGRARRGGEFVSSDHIANALEQKFLSRIYDRRRALGGRSPIEAALAGSLPIGSGWSGGAELADTRVDLERLVLARHDLRRITGLWRELSSDQRLVLASQLWDEMDRAEFCRVHGWSGEKYRKVAQRARARLTQLLAAESDPRVPLAGARRISEQGHTYEHSSPQT
jgi:DNA-directed RNA polymerase specialized sigma24 family protein